MKILVALAFLTGLLYAAPADARICTLDPSDPTACTDTLVKPQWKTGFVCTSEVKFSYMNAVRRDRVYSFTESFHGIDENGYNKFMDFKFVAKPGYRFKPGKNYSVRRHGKVAFAHVRYASAEKYCPPVR